LQIFHYLKPFLSFLPCYLRDSEPVVKEPKLAVHTSTAPHKDAEAQAKVTVKSAAIQDSPNSKSSVLIPDSVVAQEKALQAQISQLQSSIAKAKKA
jgi:hypothetical protein